MDKAVTKPIYDILTIAQRYEVGRSDGYAEGAYDAQWQPELVHNELLEIRDDVRRAREERQIATEEHSEAARAWQAYSVGRARGYREAGRMSSFLEAVSHARKLRDSAERGFRSALVRAKSEGHSLSELGRAAGLTRAGVAYLLRRERGEKR